jgi:hypothetical protein
MSLLQLHQNIPNLRLDSGSLRGLLPVEEVAFSVRMFRTTRAIFNDGVSST